MRSIRSASFVAATVLGVLVSVSGAFAQANGPAVDTLNNVDGQGLRQGWWQVRGPKPDKPDYTAGKLIEEGRYANNRRTGPWRRYWPNGEVMSEITYVMGRPKGAYATFYPDGKPEEQGTWDLDRNTGAFKRWHPNGNLAQDFVFDRYGTRDGEQKYYHENGQVELVVTIKQGKEDGTLKRYYADGELQETAQYHDGVALSSKSFAPKKQAVEPVPAADAPQAPARQADETTNAIEFRPNGMNTLYDLQHRLAQQGEYRNGRLWNGKVYRYGKSGLLYRIEVYANGRYAGNAIPTEDDRQ
jgi:antitoxin component YwqK of YwqJK toxin-antitoxin module